jgi:osmotically-inducible protein OsmY
MDNLAISNRLEIAPPLGQVISDRELASKAVSLLRWKIRYNSIRVEAQRGHVTLSGEVDSSSDITAAEQTIRKLSGVLGVTNRITTSPRVLRPQHGSA